MVTTVFASNTYPQTFVVQSGI